MRGRHRLRDAVSAISESSRSTRLTSRGIWHSEGRKKIANVLGEESGCVHRYSEAARAPIYCRDRPYQERPTDIARH